MVALSEEIDSQNIRREILIQLCGLNIKEQQKVQSIMVQQVLGFSGGLPSPPLKLISKTWLTPSRPRGYPAKAEALVALIQGLTAT
jgi:hypothetical protein